MKQYKPVITLTHNSRGVYCLDTSIGCEGGLKEDSRGCYNDCYAAKSAKLYGYDFSKTVLRYFVSRQHERHIINQINGAKLDFIRIGCSGDPSENWEHCMYVLKVIANCNKQIVIITKHWTNLTDEHLKFFNTINVCVNTSVSALDNPELLKNSLEQYNRIKPYCKSILRIVSCDLNLDNPEGLRLSIIQHGLFKNEQTIDTVFRPSKNNPFVVNGIINVKHGFFMGTKTLMSKFNKKVFLGHCSKCQEMCGAKMQTSDYKNKRILTKQLTLK